VNRPRLKTRYPGITYREGATGRTYIVSWYDMEGTKRSKHLPYGSTLEQAREFQGTLQHRKAQGESLVPTKKTVGELLDLWLASRRPSLAPNSIKAYEGAIGNHLKPAFGARKVTALSASEIATLIASMKGEGKKTWTVNQTLKPLKAAFQIAVREGWVTTSPVAKLLPHERPKGDQKDMRCLSRDEITRLLSSTTGARWRALMALLTFSGLRISEALSLTWEDVSEEKIVVRESKTKAGVREVLLIPSVRRLLTAYRLSQPPGATLVFGTRQKASCGSRETPVGSREALRALHDACLKAGLPRYTLHELRHTFASILISQGELPTLVARQMGHADPAITMKVYAHLWEEQESVSAARDRLQTAMGGLF
jgi:integrase